MSARVSAMLPGCRPSGSRITGTLASFLVILPGQAPRVLGLTQIAGSQAAGVWGRRQTALALHARLTGLVPARPVYGSSSAPCVASPYDAGLRGS